MRENKTGPNGGGGALHDNQRAAMVVDEDCVDRRSDVDDLRTRDATFQTPYHYEPQAALCKNYTLCLKKCTNFEMV